jgi:HD-like signal output (HDOD) protein
MSQNLLLSKIENTTMQWTFITNLNYMQISSYLQGLFLKLEKPYLSETVFMILKELLMNANRANSKKIFLETNSIDTSNPTEYSRAIQMFKSEIVSNWESLKGGTTNSNYNVQLSIQAKDKSISFSVSNNTPLLPIERERISIRIQKSDLYKTVIDAYKDMGDTSESAGLGIVMSILLLRNIGLDKNNLYLVSDEKSTTFELEIPLEIVPLEISSMIKDKLLGELKTLPSLSNSTQKLINLCSDPDLDMKHLIDTIEKNPSVSAEILKLANSVGFIMKSKTMPISQAVKIIGIKAILRLLYAMGSMNVLSKSYSRMEAQWENSRRTSFYASILLKDFGLGKLGESVLSGALLHNIGKIVLLSADKEFFPVVRELTNNRATENSKVLEEAAIGLSYSKLGAMLAEKWNFPEDLKCIIEYHQQPYMAPEKYQKITEIVYLSYNLASRTQGTIHFFSLNMEVLNKYKIITSDDFENLFLRLEELYKKESKD